MKFPVGNRQPVRGVFRCILGQDNIQCAVRIQLEVGAVVDAVSVDGIVNEEIILSVGGHGPEAALQRGRKGFKVECILLFSGQRCAGCKVKSDLSPFAADSCSDLLVFLLDMNNAPFVIDSVFISLSLIKGAYQSETGVIL